MRKYEFLGGDTLRIVGKFKSFNEVLVDPTDVKIKIYNDKFNLVDTVQGSSIVRDSLGIYHTEYILPEITRDVDLVFEWYGLVDANPSIDRVRVLVKFI